MQGKDSFKNKAILSGKYCIEKILDDLL